MPFVTYHIRLGTDKKRLSAREREKEEAARTTGFGLGPIEKSMAEDPGDES